MSESKIRVLYIDLLSGLWPHSLQQLKVAAQLTSENFDITHISCGSYMKNFCIVMESRNRKPSSPDVQKNFDCSSCRFAAKTINSKLNNLKLSSNSVVHLQSLVTEKIQTQVESILEANSSDEVNTSFEFEQIPLVRISLYETILKFKKKDLRLNPEEHKFFLESLRAAAYSALLAREFLLSNQKFDIAVSHSVQYSPNNAISHVLRQFGVDTYLVDGSGNIAERYSAVQMYDWGRHGLIRPSIKFWDEKFDSIRVTDNDKQRLKSHKNQLELGRSFDVYSEPSKDTFDTRNYFKFPKENKIVLLALSSVDEVFAAQTIGATPRSKYPGSVFKDQHEWVRETMEWASNREGLSMIIRMHPRDLPNKRESVKSEQAAVWEKLISDLPSNVRLNHPLDKISIQDLLPDIDVFVTGWSTTALVAAENGIPTVTYDSLVAGFPPSIHFTGDSKSEYFNNLETLVSPNEKIVQDRKQVVLWNKFNFLSGTVFLSPRLGEKLRLTGPPIFGKLLAGLEIYLYWAWMPMETFLTVKRFSHTSRIEKLLKTRSSSLYELDRFEN